jgi:molybdopterin-containing oxidoreductase family membrane subunit
MDLTTKKKTLVNEFTPSMLSFKMSTKLLIALLVLIILTGLYALYVQVVDGHLATGMRDYIVWGIYIINFIFFVTISYSGAFIGGVLHFVNTPWKNSVSRIIEIITVLSLIVGPIFILLCIGRLDRLHYLFIYPRIQSPITWDIIAIMTDLIGCFIYLFLTFVPDFAILRDNSGENVPKWRRNVYKYLAIGYQDTEEQRKLLHKTIRIMSAMIIVLAIVAYTVLAWIFSLTLQPGWNSTIFAPYFIIAGLYSGTGVIILSMYLIRRIFHLEKYIKKTHFIAAGIVLMIFGMLFGYFTFSEYFPRWFSDREQDARLMDNLYNRYFWEFIFANYIGVIIPVVILFFKRLRNIKTITFAGVIAILSLWLNRYLIVVPTLETPYMPIQDTRPEYLFYSATWVEWALTFAGFASFILMFTLIVKFVPVIPMSGIIDNEREMAKKQQTVDIEDSNNEKN